MSYIVTTTEPILARQFTLFGTIEQDNEFLPDGYEVTVHEDRFGEDHYAMLDDEGTEVPLKDGDWMVIVAGDAEVYSNEDFIASFKFEETE